MEQKDFYEVNGCSWFIPVDLIEEHECTKNLEVVATESGLTTFVPTIYKFPKPPEQQKVVVPKFVVDWIEYYKKKGRKLYYALNHVHNDDELRLYINQQEGDYTETLARAWLAYPNIEVEKEPLYTVEIPNPNSNAHTILRKTEKGIVLVAMANARWKSWEETHLTESEIKQDFDFLWQFAKDVEEK